MRLNMIVETLPRVLIVSSPVEETRWKIRAVDKKGKYFKI